MTKFIEHRSGKRRQASKKIIVLYHAGCTDGFTAAWAAFRALGKTAEYIAVEHQIAPPEGLVGKTIYLLDFTYTRPIMEQLITDNIQVTAIDHHVTVEDVTKMTHDYRYALDKSGARLAWEYFHPEEVVPFLVRVVEDMDLFRFALPETVTLFDWLDLYDFDFKTYTKLVRQLESPAGLRRALRQGTSLRAYREKVIERLLKNNTYEVQFGEYQVPCMNTSMFHGEIATALSQGRAFGVAWRASQKGIYVALRSVEGALDVGQLAKQFGGGGHAHAAGFLVPTFADLPFSPIL